jgi:hypothetical protein
MLISPPTLKGGRMKDEGRIKAILFILLPLMPGLGQNLTKDVEIANYTQNFNPLFRLKPKT